MFAPKTTIYALAQIWLRVLKLQTTAHRMYVFAEISIIIHLQHWQQTAVSNKLNSFTRPWTILIFLWHTHPIFFQTQQLRWLVLQRQHPLLFRFSVIMEVISLAVLVIAPVALVEHVVNIRLVNNILLYKYIIVNSLVYCCLLRFWFMSKN